MMLAKTADKQILESKDYIFEPKIDGYRALCIKEKNKLKFISRTGHDITHNFTEFQFSKNIKAISCKLDGEIAIFDEKGNPSFHLMQHSSKGLHNAVFIVFDILEKDGKDLKNLPIDDRKKILSKTIVEDQNLQLIPHSEDGLALWKHTAKRKLEGVIAKKKGSPYIEGRTSQWLKIKTQNTIDCVIVGITKQKREISSLCLGLYDNNVLKFIGKVGTGFSERTLEELAHLLKKDESLKIDPVSGTLPKDFIPVTPNNVCEIKYLEVTKDFRLRTPVFLKLRDDKLPKDCLLDQLNHTQESTSKLVTYEQKRDFTKSPEPNSKAKAKKTPSLIYVIQKHYATRLHYDFRLEYKGVLLSWAVPKGMPEFNEKRLAIMTEDHPLSYASFHGTIPKGNYGAGKVEIWDKGKYVNITIKDDKQLDLDAAIKKGHFNVYLKGKKLQGTYSFIRMKDKNWLITKKKDQDQETSNVVFTHLDKELDKGIKKRDIIDYYEKIWNLMLPHIKERAISLYRFPSGISKEKFFQKNTPDYFPDYIDRKEIDHENKKVYYPVVKDKDGILYLANQVDEIHIMTSKINKIDFPDKIVFDLDPTTLDLKVLKATAKKLRILIEGLGLTAFIMTTGGKGYHIVAPIKPELDCSQVREVALKIAKVLVSSDPDLLTTELLKSKRKGKIFIDVNRNSSMQTSIAPYSIRARKGITIAVPFFWEDLSKVNPDSFNVMNYKVEDPWKDFYANSVSLKKILKGLKGV